MIVVGTAAKWIRIYDTRENGTKAVRSTTAHAKSVNGIAFDPFDAKMFASFSIDEPAIKLWDIRLMNEPVKSIQTDAIVTKAMPISSIAWSQVQKNVISAMAK